MFLTDSATSVAVMPARGAVGPKPNAFFTNGDPLANIPPTDLDADFMNMLQNELKHILTAAGLAPDKTNDSQLLLAIEDLITAAAGVTSFNGRAGAVALTSADVVAALAAGALANAKLANMPADTVKANLTGAPAAPQDVTLAALAAAMSQRFTSAEVAIGGTGASVAHGLGAMPFGYSVSLRNKVAEYGYTPSQETACPIIGYDGQAGGTPLGMSIAADASDVFVTFSSTAALGIADLGSGTYRNLTPGNWVFVFRAWL